MEKTIKEIADELGVNKQKIYRYIKTNCIIEVHQDTRKKNSPKLYDDEAQTLIKQGILNIESIRKLHHEAHHETPIDINHDTLIEMLKNELEIKNEQIKDLNARLAESNAALVAAQQTAAAAQALHAGTIQQQLNQDENTHKKFFSKFRHSQKQKNKQRKQ